MAPEMEGAGGRGRRRWNRHEEDGATVVVAGCGAGADWRRRPGAASRAAAEPPEMAARCSGRPASGKRVGKR